MNSAVAEQPAPTSTVYRYLYEPGTVRWCQLSNGIKPPRPGHGWRVELVETTYHPLTFDEFKHPQTWAKETYVGTSTRART